MLTFICTSVYWLISTLFFCPDPLFIITNQNDDEFETYTTNQINHLYLESIAKDSIAFLNHYEVGAWLNEMELYSTLEADTILRNSNTTLHDFYILKQQSMIGKLENADRAIATLCAQINKSNVADLYNFAVLRNAEISNGQDWEQNEADVNNLGLKIATQGIKSLTTAERNTLKTLSYTCPYVGGNAVFKARSLYAMYNPTAQYNDRVICIPQAQNKGENTNSTSYDVDSLNEAEAMQQLHVNYLEQITKAEHENSKNETIIISKLTENEIVVYPNPTTDFVTINYNSLLEGDLFIYNQVGEVVVKEKIYNNSTIKLTNFSNGIYSYKIILDKQVYNGKLTIKK